MRAVYNKAEYMGRFMAAKKEADQGFENLRGADMDEAVAYCRDTRVVRKLARY
ncbi:MAG TPA: hypothetical protein VGN24_02725 [Rhodanobacter sp.]|jgi:hypothetical protein|nr:hypothetical protein [Rhodanobacter sp.]